MKYITNNKFIKIIDWTDFTNDRIKDNIIWIYFSILFYNNLTNLYLIIPIILIALIIYSINADKILNKD